MKIIGKRIKEIRQEKGLTQEFVAKRLGYKHSSMLSEIESEKKGLDADKIPLLANILEVDINNLFFKNNITKREIILAQVENDNAKKYHVEG